MTEFLNRWLNDPTLARLIAAAFGIVIVSLVVRFLNRWLSRWVKDSETKYRLRKMITFLGYVVVLLVISNIYSSGLSGLTVAFGVAGAGIAFALQEVIASFAGWFAISFAGFYRTGDRVQLGGIRGDVIDIGVLRTTLMEVGEWVNADLYSGRVVRIANSFVFKEPVFNYSGDFPFLWDEIKVPVKYGSDRKLARETLERVTHEVIGDYTRQAGEAWSKMTSLYLVEHARVEPMITLVATDNWLEFTIRYVVDYKLRRMTKDRLFHRILDEFDISGGRIGIASATFHLVETPTLDVRLNAEKSDNRT